MRDFKLEEAEPMELKTKLKRTMKSAIAAIVKTKKISFKGIEICGAFQDFGTLNAIEKGKHEVFFTQLFLDNLRPGITVVDVGAHLGKYSLLAGKTVGSTGRVYSFEPHPRTYSYFADNVKNNHFENTITPHHMAISDQNGTTYLQADLLQADFSSLSAVRDPSEVKQVEVKTSHLDTEIGLTPVDVFKIDVEGAELLVLSGIKKIVEHSRVKGIDPVLFIESNSEALQAFSKTPKDLYQKILTLGFKKVEKIDEENTRLTPINLEQKEMCENWICR